MFAQNGTWNVKEGVITFALTETYQTSVSTSATKANQGNWSDGPLYYKTAQRKVTERTILDSIGQVLYNNPNYYSRTAARGKPAARLILTQGELSGFFNIVPELADVDTDVSYAYTKEFEGEEVEPLPNTGHAVDSAGFSSTIEGTFVRLATGRNLDAVPEDWEPELETAGAWPPGHHQPWGQIFVKDSQREICDNVTFFFAITVQECYDCLYLNSFVTDTKFALKKGYEQQEGPPCCSTYIESSLTGSGVDRYYMSLSFDNTIYNPYLYPPNSRVWIGVSGSPYAGVVGLGYYRSLPGDGIVPDFLPYVDKIISGLGTPSPHVLRFTLNGILTYKWKLAKFNAGDLVLDFIQNGTPATYTANGYSFHALYCGLLTGTMKINETLVNSSKVFCCENIPWYDSWYGVGWNKEQHPWHDYWDSPINVPASLSFHVGRNQYYEPLWQWPKLGMPAVPWDEVGTWEGQRETSVPGSRWHLEEPGEPEEPWLDK